MSFLNQLSAATRIYTLVFMAVGLFLGIAIFAAEGVTADIRAERQAQLERQLKATMKLLERFEAAARTDVMPEKLAKARAAALLSSMPLGEGGAVVALDKNGVALARATDGASERLRAAAAVDSGRITTMAVFVPWGWRIRSSVLAAVHDARIERRTFAIFGVAIGAVLFFFVLAMMIVVSILRPLRTLSVRMQLMAEGDLRTEIPFTDYADEAGDMARSVAEFRVNVRRMRRKNDGSSSALVSGVRRLKSALAAGRRAPSEGLDPRLEELAAAVDLAQERQATALGALDAEAKQLSEAARRATEAEAARSEALEALTEAESALAGLASKAAAAAEAAGAPGAADLAREVSYQSSLVALSAAIEAARAGRAGEGFGAVVQEARNLTERAEEAAAMIQRSLDSASDTNALIAATSAEAARVGDARALLASAARSEEAVEVVETEIETVGDDVSEPESEIEAEVVGDASQDASSAEVEASEDAPGGEVDAADNGPGGDAEASEDGMGAAPEASEDALNDAVEASKDETGDDDDASRTAPEDASDADVEASKDVSSDEGQTAADKAEKPMAVSAPLSILLSDIASRLSAAQVAATPPQDAHAADEGASDEDDEAGDAGGDEGTGGLDDADGSADVEETGDDATASTAQSDQQDSEVSALMEEPEATDAEDEASSSLNDIDFSDDLFAPVDNDKSAA